MNIDEMDACDMDHILRILLPIKSITSDALTRDAFQVQGKSYVTTLLNKIEQYYPPVIELKKGDLLVARKTDFTQQFLDDGGFVQLYNHAIKSEDQSLDLTLNFAKLNPSSKPIPKIKNKIISVLKKAGLWMVSSIWKIIIEILIVMAAAWLINKYNIPH